jgi:hypothetical protein
MIFRLLTFGLECAHGDCFKFEPYYLDPKRKAKMSEEKKAAPTTETDPLAKEIAALEAELPKLAGEVGKFAVVFGGKVIGTFPTYQEALTKGYEVAKLEPFLVQQISSLPQVQHFSRAIGYECLTSS